MQGVVYKITNNINGMAYIGQTIKQLRKRWTDHLFNSIGKGKGKHKSYLHRAIEKYGEDNFSIEILNVCVDKKALDVVEMFYIKNMNTLGPNGYNISLGGTGVMHGRKMSPEAVARIRQANLGKKLSPEHAEKLRLSKLGKKRSPEVIEKMRLANLGRKLSTEHKKKLSLVHNSPEVKEKNRLAHLGRKHSPEVRERIRLASNTPEAKEKHRLSHLGKSRGKYKPRKIFE
jgi:group I intron endonuclease